MLVLFGVLLWGGWTVKGHDTQGMSWGEAALFALILLPIYAALIALLAGVAHLFGSRIDEVLEFRSRAYWHASGTCAKPGACACQAAGVPPKDERGGSDRAHTTPAVGQSASAVLSGVRQVDEARLGWLKTTGVEVERSEVVSEVHVEPPAAGLPRMGGRPPNKLGSDAGVLVVRTYLGVE